MKQYNNFQNFGRSKNAIPGIIISAEVVKEPFYLPGSYSPGKAGDQIFNQGATLFPVVINGPFHYETPVKKMNSISKAIKPNFNDCLKETAACLSGVEMALECYNVSELQFSTHALKELFFAMKMPAVYKLAVQMEESAKEYQLQEVKDLLKEIKRTIGQIVKHRKQPWD